MYISPERLDVYPPEYVESSEETPTRYIIRTTDGEEHRYRITLIDSLSTIAPDSLPRFASFKFNNKFNDQVFTDVIGTIQGDSLITASVGAIGKWLTPSFQLYDSLACVYVDTVRQYSKVSRLRFEDPVTYRVQRPGWQIMGPSTQTENEQEETPSVVEEIVTQVVLTPEMLSTNAPTNFPDTEGLDKLLDEDLSTMFHSTWSTGAYEKLSLDETPYIDVALPELLHKLQFSYTTRSTNGRHPLSIRIYARNEDTEWVQIRDFTVEDDGLPITASTTYQSSTIDLGDDYSFLRLEQTQCAYKNYLAWAELAIYKVEEKSAEQNTGSDGETDLGNEPVSLQWFPYGRTYQVSVDWPTDRAVMTPTIRVVTETGEMVTSKEYYLNATISIDGAGVYPDMPETAVLIKGRGNTSWNMSKKPYRLKFETKQKPFGLTKGKSWVLQANAQRGSMMVNAIGMKIAHLMDAAYPTHVVPVELYMNDTYMGSYIFNEKIGFANNNIDLLDETAATLLELDTYYDETYKFKSQYYNLPVNVKEPDFSDTTTETQLTFSDIQTDFNQFVSVVIGGEEVSDWVDVNYLASFLSTTELVGNYEVMHPKSVFLYKENMFGDSKYIFGPVWDLDWAFGYEESHQYYTSGDTDQFYSSPKYTFSESQASSFWKQLRYSSEAVDRAYYKLWTVFMKNGGIDEVIDFCDDYFSFAEPSFQNNAQKWGDGYSTSYSTYVSNAKTWLRRRAESIYAQLTPYDLTDELQGPEYWNPSEATVDNDDPEVIDKINDLGVHRQPTYFNVFDLRGVQLKRQATYDTWRNGLAPGIYIVNGKKVLVK